VNPYESITRRQLLRRAAAGGAVLSLPALLAACGGGGGIEGQAGQTQTEETTTQIRRELAEKLTISNWILYIDINEETKKRPTVEQFEKETGVQVRYIEDIDTNEGWFGKFQAQLSQGQAIDRDITVLTDWMAARMVRLGYVQRVDKSAIPNAENLVDTLKSPGWDPNRDYSLPWQSGITGIAYDAKLTGPITSIDQLLTDPKLKGKVTVLDDIASCMTVILLANGDDPENVTPEAFDRGIQMLQEGLESGHIRQILGNDYTIDLANGNVWAAMAWSGDVIQLQLDNPNLKFVIPETGGEIFTDNMLIPTGGDVFTASTWMNFVYDPAVAAQIAAYVNYICPVKGAKEEIAKIDKSLASDPLIFPDAETLSNVKAFDPKAADNRDFREKFANLTLSA
jgi:spermidine/putrescine transport system substrate-binding protein